jgi:hypothetical protein
MATLFQLFKIPYKFLKNKRALDVNAVWNNSGFKIKKGSKNKLALWRHATFAYNVDQNSAALM